MTRKDFFRYVFWEWIEPIGSALGIALLVMHYVMALYVIPTGSMQPTLHGAGDYGVGDKVLVNKFLYRFNPPERWDVFVFHYPYKNVLCAYCEQTLIQTFPSDGPEEVPPQISCPRDSCQTKPRKFDFVEKEYIKRCVALPGDEISVRDGNIVLWDEASKSFKPSIKTAVAQDALWVDAFDSEDKTFMEMPSYFWKGSGSSVEKWQPGSSHITMGSETLLFHNSERLVGYGDKAGPNPIKAPPCGDVAIDLEVDQWPNSGELELDISRNVVSHQLTVNFSQKKWSIRYAGADVDSASGVWNTQTQHLRFGRVDGQIQLIMDDQLQEWPVPHFDVDDTTTTIYPKIRYQGEQDLSMTHLRILRDIYYVDSGNPFLSGPRHSYKLRSGEFFAMGDNSFHSFDSRDWGPVPQEKLIGKALIVLLPLGRTKFIH